MMACFLGVFCIILSSKKDGSNISKAEDYWWSFRPQSGDGYDNSNAHENAYLACLYDDTTNSFRTVVIHSGMELEYNRVAAFFPYNSLSVDGESSGLYRLPIYNTVYYTGHLGTNGNNIESLEESGSGGRHCLYFNENGFHWLCYEFEAKYSDTGVYNSDFLNSLSNEFRPIQEVNAEYELTFGKTYCALASSYVSNTSVRPLTFPGVSNRDATTADINRAYAVSDAIGKDFMDALTFLNDGNAYNGYDDLYAMAYTLVTASSGVTVTNQYGSSYMINYRSQPDSSGYLWQVDITCLDNNPNTNAFGSNKRTFNYKVKKGYRNCTNKDKTETGSQNNLNVAGCDSDTVYITWEHLFLEAIVLNEQGVTYANQTDLYSVTAFEDSILKTSRNLLNGLRSILDVFAMDELIFNLGQRSTDIYVFGLYKKALAPSLSILYLIISCIALSLYTISLIKLLIDRQVASFSPSARVSIVNGVKNILMALAFSAFAWVFFRIALMINYRFVGIFQSILNGKTFFDAVGVYTTMAGVLFQYVILIITVYVNFIYIIRGIIVPMLFCASPLFIYAFSLGAKGAMVTKAWIKELLGNIFIQSVHAFVYGFIIYSSAGMRGIESVILCCSIIPLTSITKNIFGMGGDTLLKAGSSLTSSASNLASTKIGMDVAEKAASAQISGSVLGSVAGGIGTVAGVAAAPFTGGASLIAGSAIGTAAGGAFRGGGQFAAAKIQKEAGMKQLGLGAGTSFALMGEDGGAGTRISAEGGHRVQQSSYEQAAAIDTIASSLSRGAGGIAYAKTKFNSGGGSPVGNQNQRIGSFDALSHGTMSNGNYVKLQPDNSLMIQNVKGQKFSTSEGYANNFSKLMQAGGPGMNMPKMTINESNNTMTSSRFYRENTSEFVNLSKQMSEHPGGRNGWLKENGMQCENKKGGVNVSFVSQLKPYEQQQPPNVKS